MSEKSLIDEIEQILDVSKKNLLGINEDAVAFTIENKQVVVNVDAWVESTDRVPGFESFDCGFRAAINSISDIYAKGGKPLYLLASSGISAEKKNEIVDIVKGINEACKIYGIVFMGGDLNQSNDLFIDITVVGIAKKLHKRSTANVGENVYWLGPPLGENTAAFGILLQNWIGDKDQALNILRKPKLYPEFLNLNTNAAIDCSDGLAKTLHILAESSQTGIELHFEVEYSSFVKQVALENKKELEELALYGGEELGIVFTASNSASIPNSCILIGKIIEGSGILFNKKQIPNRGWDHFQ